MRSETTIERTRSKGTPTLSHFLIKSAGRQKSVTLSCTLWFFDKAVETSRRDVSPRRDKVPFLDARHIYQQIDRAHRDFTSEQIEFLATIVQLYRGEKREVSPDLPDALPSTENQISNPHSAIGNSKLEEFPEELETLKAGKLWREKIRLPFAMARSNVRAFYVRRSKTVPLYLINPICRHGILCAY